MIDVSVVMVNYREADKTREAVEAVLQSTGVSFEVFLIDNSCDEVQAARLSLIDDPRVRLFISDSNIGLALACNLALNNVTGRYVFTLNNDAVLIDRSGLAQMAEYLDANPGVAALQPKILSINDHRKFDYAGASGGHLDKYGYPFCRGRLFQTMEEDCGEYDDIADINWASGCAFFVRREVLAAVKGFDPVYFAYAEDVDVSLAIWKLGYRIRSFPAVRISHEGSLSWNKRKAFKIELIHRNHLIMFLKCYRFKESLRRFPLRMLLEVASMIFYAVNGEPGLVISVLRAHLQVIRLLPYIARARRPLFADGKPIPAPFYGRSIVISYYFRGIRKFSDLNPEDFV